MSELGAVDTEIAAALGVSLACLNVWKGKHPEIVESLKLGKEQPDKRVKRSLYQRAMGYSHPEIDIRTVTLPNGGGSEIVKTPIIKHYPPDTTACIFWLKNRMPEEFRQTPEPVDPDGETIEPTEITIERKDARIAEQPAD